MFLTKLDNNSESKFEPNVYDYSYLLSKSKDRVGHFISEKSLKNRNEMAGSKAYICKNREEFKSHFDLKYKTELYHIEK